VIGLCPLLKNGDQIRLINLKPDIYIFGGEKNSNQTDHSEKGGRFE
jgi:hypothetical protein